MGGGGMRLGRQTFLMCFQTNETYTNIQVLYSQLHIQVTAFQYEHKSSPKMQNYFQVAPSTVIPTSLK